MSDPHARQLLLAASDVVEAFVDAVAQEQQVAPADAALTSWCRDTGTDNAAATLAAFSALTLLIWSESSGEPVEEVLAWVRRRLSGGGGPPPAGVREPRRPAPTTGGAHQT